MTRKWTLLAVVSLTSLWLGSGIAYAEEFKGKTETRTLGNTQVDFITQADGTLVGENQIAVQLKDTATGQPIVQPSVRVELAMDEADKSMTHGSMDSQKPVVAELAASRDVPGKYSGKVTLSDAGKWNARVIPDARNAQRTVTFGIQVAGKGPNWLLVGGFVGLLLLIVGVVAVMKRKVAAPMETAAVEPVQP